MNKIVDKNLNNNIFKRSLSFLQKIGKSLLFPVAMLPLAAILLRLGAAIPGTTDFSKFISSVFLAIANGVFGNAMPILFAIGISFGMSRENRGEAAIIGFSVMVIFTILLSENGIFGGADLVHQIYGGMKLNGGWGFKGVFGRAYNSILANNVFTGIFAGGIVAYIYNRYNGIELPSILGFFSGRRLIPVLSFIATFVIGIMYAIIFPWFGVGLFYIGKAVGSAQGSRWSNAGIMGFYGIINRLLIPFGLHHVVNTPLWFTEIGGSHVSVTGKEVVGDIFVFANGASAGNNSGTFQAGFFPAMMFGLPALAVAIWYNAKDQKQKAKVASLLAGASLVSFFTGITEPIEFAFLFVAPLLFIMHAILTGVSAFFVGLFGIQLGFGFSAGLIDYLLSIPKSLEIIKENKTGFSAVMAHPVWIWVIGAATSVLYFFGANFLIKKFDLPTPGRKDNLLDVSTEENVEVEFGAKKYIKDARLIIQAVGKSNIISVSNCATRLRFELKDNSIVDESIIKKTKALGHVKIANGYQIVMGPTVEMYYNEIQKLLKK